MNWGKGIALTLGAFIVFIMYMVIQQMSTRIDLVSDDYYIQEVNYSSELKAINRDRVFKKRPKVSQTEKHLVIQLPTDIDLKKVNIKLRRPNNEEDDLQFSVEGTKMFIIDKDKLIEGNYQIVISYELDDILYIQKKDIVI